MSVPHQNSLCGSLAAHPGIQAAVSTRVVTMAREEAGWVLGTRRSDAKSGELAVAGPFSGLIVSDKQAASQFATRQFGELPLMDSSAAIPEAVRGIGRQMQGVGQEPRFVLMLAAQRPPGRPAPPAILDGPPGSIIVRLVRDSAKPGRKAGPLDCWVVTSSAAFAQEMIGSQGMTKLGTSTHAELLEAVADLLAKEAGRILGPELGDVVYRVAHRWGACFPGGHSADRCMADPVSVFAACGDYCGAPHGSVEAAVLSGMAAADVLAAALPRSKV